MNPKNFIIYDFDLTALLKLGDLEMRRVSEDDKNLIAGEYFRMLSLFLNLAPDVSGAIKKFAINDSDTRERKIIESMISLFKEMGCNKFIPDLYTMSHARGKGDHRLAAFQAKKIEESFNDFYSQIMSAKITKKAEPESPLVDSTLFSCIKALDEEKANRKRLVLAVDDSLDILEAVSTVLSSEYNVFKLPKSMMLENVLKQVNPDLFLLDYQMPGLNGFELIPIIRGFEEHKNTPIIFLTSKGTVDNITAAIGLGASDFIVKPFNPDQLREKVAKHITR